MQLIKPKLRRLSTAQLTDSRLRLMNEIISGMRVIKMYSWEKPFADLVAKARKYISTMMIIKVIVSSIAD